MRAAHFLSFRGTPFYTQLLVDSAKYDLDAQVIAQGRWFGDAVFYQDPLYAYFLGAIYAVFGHRPVAAYLTQMLLGCALCLLVVVLAVRLFAASPHRDAIAWLSGLLCALCTPFVYYDLLLIKTSLALFLTVAHLVVLAGIEPQALGARRRRAGALLAVLAAGVLLGLNVLSRGIYLPLTPLFAAWIAYRVYGGAAGGTKRTRFSGAALAVTLYALGTALVVLPVSARNHAIGGEWVISVANGGMNLFIGNNPDNTTGTYDVPDSIRPSPEFEREDWHAFAERTAGRALTLNEADRFFIAEVWRWVSREPVCALRNYLHEWGLWLAGYEVADTYSFEFFKANASPVLRLPVAGPYTLIPLGWAGLLLALAMAMARRRDATWSVAANPNLLLAASFVVRYSLAFMMFFVLSRYRVQVYPLLIVFSSALLVWALASWRRSGRRARALVTVPVALLALLAWRPL